MHLPRQLKAATASWNIHQKLFAAR